MASTMSFAAVSSSVPVLAESKAGAFVQISQSRLSMATCSPSTSSFSGRKLNLSIRKSLRPASRVVPVQVRTIIVTAFPGNECGRKQAETRNPAAQLRPFARPSKPMSHRSHPMRIRDTLTLGLISISISPNNAKSAHRGVYKRKIYYPGNVA